MPRVFDISVIGDRSLQRKLDRLAGPRQKVIMRRALRGSAKRTKQRVLFFLSGGGSGIDVRTGDTLRAFQKAKIRSATQRRSVIRLGLAYPERAELGIAASDQYYYPTALEYGHGSVPPHPYMRPAIDNFEASEKRLIGQEVGAGIEKEWKRK